MKNSPCLGCKDRVPACHDKCTRYKEWFADYQTTKEMTRNKPHPADAVRIVNYFKKRKKNHHE